MRSGKWEVRGLVMDVSRDSEPAPGGFEVGKSRSRSSSLFKVDSDVHVTVLVRGSAGWGSTVTFLGS